MTTTTTAADASVIGAHALAEVLATSLPLPVPVQVQEPVMLASLAALPPGLAVMARCEGASQGEIALVLHGEAARAALPAGASGAVEGDGGSDGDAGEPAALDGTLTAVVLAMRQAVGGVLQAVLHEPQTGDAQQVLALWGAEPGAYAVTFAEAGAAPGAEPVATLVVALTGTAPSAAATSAGGLGEGPDLTLLSSLELAVTVELGRTRMPLRDLLSLTPGTLVELDRAAGSPADLLVNGRLVARGEVVVVDEDYALRITQIVGAGEQST